MVALWRSEADGETDRMQLVLDSRKWVSSLLREFRRRLHTSTNWSPGGPGFCPN